MIRIILTSILLIVSMKPQTPRPEISQHDEHSLDYYKKLPSNVYNDVQTRMKQIELKRAQKYPKSRVLQDINEDKNIKLHFNHTLYNFEWRNDTYTRSTDPQSDQEVDIFKIKHVKSIHKKVIKPLYDRFKKRDDKGGQMQCMLYIMVMKMKRFTQLNYLQVKAKFRSNCMRNEIIRVFVARDAPYLAQVLKIAIPNLKMPIYIEYNNSPRNSGGSANNVDQYSEYRLLNFYYARVNRIEGANSQIDKKSKNENDSQSGQNPNYGKKNDNIPVEDQQLTSSDADKLNTLPEFIKIVFNVIKQLFGKKKRARKLSDYKYKSHIYDNLPFYQTGLKYEIIANNDHQQPYFDLEKIKLIWEGNNPLDCQKQTLQPEQYEVMEDQYILGIRYIVRSWRLTNYLTLFCQL